MGLFSNVNKTCSMGISKTPPYCCKSIGSRHFLIAGGGGASKTGIDNEITLYLLTYNQISQPNNKNTKLEAKATSVINTELYANMCMDTIALSSSQTGRYLIAVGQDKYCGLYETTNFCLTKFENCLVGSKLSLNFVEIGRFQTDFSSKFDSYQKCVKFFYVTTDINKFLYIATGGVDGRVRIWNALNFLEQNKNEKKDCEKIKNFQPETEIEVSDGEVVNLDVALSGNVIGTISKSKAILWNTKTSEKIFEIPTIEKFKNAKVGFLKFLNWDKSRKNEIFLCGYNQYHIRNPKMVSILAIWNYENKSSNCYLIKAEIVCHDGISSLSINENGQLVAIGTRGGSVGVYNCHNLKKPLYFVKASHSSVITAVEFLPQRSYDVCNFGRISSDNENSQCYLPGVCSGEAFTSVLSVSVDKQIQVHKVSYEEKLTFSSLILRTAILISLIYIFFWFLFYYEG